MSAYTHSCSYINQKLNQKVISWKQRALVSRLLADTVSKHFANNILISNLQMIEDFFVLHNCCFQRTVELGKVN